jgi:hypothetical protein
MHFVTRLFRLKMPHFWRLHKAADILVLAVLIAPLTDHSKISNQFGAEGMWTEACCCSRPCHCFSTGRANVVKCVTAEVYSFPAGIYKNRMVGPATAALLSVSQHPFAVPPPEGVLYVDNSADQYTVDALKAMFACAYGLSPDSELRKASIKTALSDRRKIVEITQVLKLETSPLSGLAASTASPDEQSMYPWVKDVRQWRAVRFKTRSEAGSFDFTDTNALVGRFLQFGCTE